MILTHYAALPQCLVFIEIHRYVKRKVPWNGLFTGYKLDDKICYFISHTAYYPA